MADGRAIEFSGEKPNWPSFHVRVAMGSPEGTQIKLTLKDGRTATLAPREAEDWFYADRGLFNAGNHDTKAHSLSEAMPWRPADARIVHEVYSFLRKIGTPDFGVRTGRTEGDCRGGRLGGDRGRLATADVSDDAQRQPGGDQLSCRFRCWTAATWCFCCRKDIRGPASERVIVAFTYAGLRVHHLADAVRAGTRFAPDFAAIVIERICRRDCIRRLLSPLRDSAIDSADYAKLHCLTQLARRHAVLLSAERLLMSRPGWKGCHHGHHIGGIGPDCRRAGSAATAHAPSPAPTRLNAAGADDITLLDSADKAYLLARSKPGRWWCPPISPRPIDRRFRSTMSTRRLRRLSIIFAPSAEVAIGISPQASVSSTARISRRRANPSRRNRRRRRRNRCWLDHSQRRTHHGRMPNRRTGHDFSRRGAVRKHARRPALHHSRRRGVGSLRIWLQVGRRPARAVGQLGYVELGPDVEVGAGSTIDRGTYGATFIGDGTKIDNLVMIAHNCRIGRHNLICSQVGVAGSTTTGDYVVMAGQVGVRDHVHIGTGAVLGAKAGVSGDVRDGVRMLGTPAVPNASKSCCSRRFRSCPKCASSCKELQRQVRVVDRKGPLP